MQKQWRTRPNSENLFRGIRIKILM